MTESDIRRDIGQCIQDSFDVNNERGSRNDNIMTLFKYGFQAFEPTGARKFESMMLQQIMWRIMDKTKPLDFRLQANRPPEIEQLVTYGLSTMADRSGLIQNLRSKQGVYWNSYLFGDGFYMWGTQDNEDIPITFSVVPNSNFYCDQFSTALRATTGRSSTKVLVIFSMDTKQAQKLYPKIASSGPNGEGATGQIPRDINAIANIETGRGNIQSWTIQKDITEIGYWFDISDQKKPVHTIIAGEQMAIIKKKQGDEYPFWLDGQPYIPVGQRMCMPSAQGFYNYGIGDLFYQLAVLSRRMMNLAYGHAEEAVYPTAVVSIAQGTADAFFSTLASANAAKARGEKPIVPLEYDPSSPNGNRVGVQTLQTQAAMGEFQVMYDLITKEINRAGIVLDDLDLNPNATQYQILAEEEKSTAWVKQVQEYNASDWEFTLKVMLDLSKKFIKKSNKSRIDLPVAINVDGVSVKGGDFTLGAWKDELSKYNYFPKVDSRSGAVPSSVVEQARLERVMARYAPGSPELNTLNKQYAALQGIEIPEAPQVPQQGMEGGGMPPEDPGKTGQPSMGDRIPLEQLAGQM